MNPSIPIEHVSCMTYATRRGTVVLIFYFKYINKISKFDIMVHIQTMFVAVGALPGRAR